MKVKKWTFGLDAVGLGNLAPSKKRREYSIPILGTTEAADFRAALPGAFRHRSILARNILSAKLYV